MAEREIIRIKIAETWTVHEFEELMSSLQFLRNIALLSELEQSGVDAVLSVLEQREQNTANLEQDLTLSYVGAHFFRLQLQMIFASAEDQYALELHRLQFASPGFVDVAGLGKVVEQIRIFATDIYDRYANREDRKIARKIAEQELLAKKIANAEALLKLGKRVGLDKHGYRTLVGEVLNVDNFISDQTESGKIVGIKKLKY
jgi:hypothetical protein